jgi:hypothetical protein
MAKKTSIDKLSAAIHDILEYYGEDVNKNVGDVVKRVAQKGAQAVKSAARSTFGGTGEYASGWTSRIETGRLSTQGIIYQSTVPGLPHLLENGHANRGGGRTPGRPHIKPVEDEIVREFITEVSNSV